MTLAITKAPIVYPETDGKPMTESDIARDYLIYAVDVLEYYFSDQENVYVSGNLFIYYEQDVSDAVVSPDVFVIFGVSKEKRISYKVWEENDKTPSWVLEITSASTRNTDSKEKPLKYAQMGVAEYFQYDPRGDYLRPDRLKGFHLVEGQYEPMSVEFLSDGELSIRSEVLGLELRVISGQLRFYDPVAEEVLPSYSQARAIAAQTKRQRDAEAQARRDAIGRLLNMGLTVEQVARALDLPIDEVQSYKTTQQL